jgi:hypothetical protein
MATTADIAVIAADIMVAITAVTTTITNRLRLEKRGLPKGSPRFFMSGWMHGRQRV